MITPALIPDQPMTKDNDELDPIQELGKACVSSCFCSSVSLPLTLSLCFYSLVFVPLFLFLFFFATATCSVGRVVHKMTPLSVSDHSSAAE